MNDFTASNGVRIEAAGNDTAYDLWNIGGNEGVPFTSDEWQALREFFRAEEDERLGRWRWPENPDFVVYPRGRAGIRVTSESSGEYVFATRESAMWWKAGEATFFGAARAYFDAHPEPRPWHDAKPGEVWALTVDGEESAFYPSKSLDRAFTPVAPETGRTAVSMESFEITAGRRIYPEVTE